MTYKQIEEQALQLLFAYTVQGTVVDDGNTRDLLLAMPEAINAAMAELAQDACPIVRTLMLAQPQPLYTCAQCTGAVQMPYPAQAGGASLYAHGQVQMTLTDVHGDVLQQDAGTGRMVLRQTVEADGTLTLTPQGGARIAGAAVWQGAFADAAEVPLWRSGACGYDLRALVHAQCGRDYLALAAGPQAVDAHGQAHPFLLEGDGQLYVYGPAPVTIHATVLPQRMDENTPPGASPEIDPKGQGLIAYAVAAQLMAEDDLALSQQYRAQFETQKQQLMALQRGTAGQPFACQSGWVR